MKTNMKTNIIIISYAYSSRNVVGALRANAIAKNLDKSKYSITVITCKLPEEISAVKSKKEIISQGNKVRVIKIGRYIGGVNSQAGIKNTSGYKSIIKSLVYKLGQKIIYPDKGVFWYYDVKSYLNKNKHIIEDAHIVLSSCPIITNHNVARYIKKVNPKVKWVADFRDFYYIEALENKESLSSVFHKKLEAKFMKEASNLIFVTETMLKAYQKHYIKYADKMQCIYNGFDEDDMQYIYSKPLENKLSFFYAGSFYSGLRSPLPLLEILDKAFESGILLKEEVVVRIAGNVDDEMKATIEKYESSHCIDYLGFISRTEALNHMLNSTFLWLIVGNIKSHYQTVPAKLFEYIAVRRPIVNFAPLISEASKIIQENNLGFNFDTLNFDIHNSYPLFEDLITSYKSGYFNQPLESDTLEKFSWDNQILLLESVLQSL